MQNRIEISNISNTCRYYGRQADAALLDSELDRISRQQLPQAIDHEINRQLAPLISGEGIIRIRQLKLKFTLLKRDFSLAGLAGLLAHRLVAALKEQLIGTGDNIRFYDNEADYIATLICDLLDARAWQTWEYEEFKALSHLPSVEAIVQLLLPRDRILHEIIPRLDRRGRLASLLQALNREQSTRLFEQWTGHDPVLPFDATILPGLDQLLLQLERFDDMQAVFARVADSWEIQTLAIYFEALKGALVTQPAAALWVAAHCSFLLQHRSRIQVLLTQIPDSRDRDEALPVDPGDNQDITAAMLGWVAADPRHRDYLDKLLQVTQTPGQILPPIEFAASTPEPVYPSDHHGALRAFGSDYAGLVLLIPVIVSLGLHKYYAPAQLRRALAFAVADQPDWRQLDWLKLLLPDNETPDTTSLPPNWQLGLSDDSQRQIEQLQGASQLAQLMLAQFAARLGGLQLSTRKYLRKQFFRQQGSIVISETRVEVILDSVPLQIVLRMAGFSDWLDKLPWLDLELKIGIRH